MTTKAKSSLRKTNSDTDPLEEDMCCAATCKGMERKLSVGYRLKLRREIHGVFAFSDGDAKIVVIVQDVFVFTIVLPAMPESWLAKTKEQVRLPMHIQYTAG